MKYYYSATILLTLFWLLGLYWLLLTQGNLYNWMIGGFYLSIACIPGLWEMFNR